MPKVIIPTPLRQYAGKQEAIEVKAKTVGELLTQLVTQYSDLRRHLYTDDGKLRSFVNIYVNDEDIRYREKENTAVKDDDVVSIVPSIAGGVDKAMSVLAPSPQAPAWGITAPGGGCHRARRGGYELHNSNGSSP